MSIRSQAVGVMEVSKTRLHNVLVAGMQHAQPKCPTGAGAEMDMMYQILDTNRDVERWVKNITNKQSLVSNGEDMVVEWILVSAGGAKKNKQGKTKKDLFIEVMNSPGLDKEKNMMTTMYKGYMYALVPVFKDRPQAAKVIKSYMKMHEILHVGVVMVDEYMLTVP